MSLDMKDEGDEKIPVVHAAVRIIIMKSHYFGLILSDANVLRSCQISVHLMVSLLLERSINTSMKFLLLLFALLYAWVQPKSYKQLLKI